MAVVVTGATGNVGRALVAQLANAGVEVRAVTRYPESAGFSNGVEVVKSAPVALPGASAVFLNSGALGDQLATVVELAWWAGVRRLVALSAVNADDDFSRQPSRFFGDRNKEAEQMAIDSGMQWVSLRPSTFACNFASMWSAQIRAGDVVAGPDAAACCAPITERDIAAVAARAMLTDELVGQRIRLTGPQAHTNAELVEIIGSVLHRRLCYHEVPPQLLRQHLTAIGVSGECSDAYVALAFTANEPAVVTPDVENVLGRPAESFAQWVAEHRSLFTR
jgi:uncharacterized protein YbjT (DUF2867 family)